MPSNDTSKTTLVPNARQALDNMKYQIAGQVGVNLKQGYNGDLPARDAGRIGGQMVKQLIHFAETNMSGGAGGGGTPGQW